jgi:hypothetical protein
MTFHKEKEALWKNTEKLDSFLGRANEFDAIFYVGGHGRKLFPSSPISNHLPPFSLLPTLTPSSKPPH